jgi:hypothetical protein
MKDFLMRLPYKDLLHDVEYDAMAGIIGNIFYGRVHRKTPVRIQLIGTEKQIRDTHRKIKDRVRLYCMIKRLKHRR